MAYKDYVEKLWKDEYRSKECIEANDLESLKAAWGAIKKDFGNGDLTYDKIDMKQVKSSIPGKNKGEKNDAYHERIYKMYPNVFEKDSVGTEIKNVNALAKKIDDIYKDSTFGRRLLEIQNGDMLCGKSAQYSVAFGIAVKYDVIESYKKICSNKDIAYTRDTEIKSEDWGNLLANIEKDDWLVKYPVTKPGKDEDNSQLDVKTEKGKIDKIVKTANDVIVNLCGVKSIKDIEEIENGESKFSGLFKRACLLQSISISDGNIQCPLIFQNLGKNSFKEFYLGINGKVDNKNYKTWASKSKYVIDKLYELTSAEKNVENTFRLGALAWKLTLNSDFVDIDNPDYKQIIYTGAPGTGKTYGIAEYVKQACLINEMDNKAKEGIKDKEFEQWKFVQFHSSYDYSDFVEGLRPVQLKEGQNPTFVRMDGTFKRFCRGVVEYNNMYYGLYKQEIDAGKKERAEKTISFYFIIDEINRADIGKVFGELMYGLEESYRGKKNPISTQYMNLDTYIKNQNGGEGEDKFVPLTDENADVFYKGFYIPENVRIIGSMNDIDRSVETFDFALRRRFQWKNIDANDKDRLKSVLESMFIKYKEEEKVDSEKEKYDSAINNLDELIDKHIIPLNKVISGESNRVVNGTDYGLGKEYQLGPAYFKKYRGDEQSLKLIWEENIEPILKEYIRGRDNEGAFIDACKNVFLGEQTK